MAAYWSLTNRVPPLPSLVASVPSGLVRPSLSARLLARLLHWQQRAAQRRHLAGLDQALLRDIGISRADAHREACKPFWRA